MGAESLFRKYLQHLINYVCQVLNTASDVASRSNKHFYTVCNILKNTGVGELNKIKTNWRIFKRKLLQIFSLISRNFATRIINLSDNVTRRSTSFIA